MPLRTRAGEVLLGLVFIAAGLFWIHQALKMRLWEGFAPASGFLPLIYGMLLVVLAAAAVVGDLLAPAKDDADDRQPIGRVGLVLLAIAAGAAGIETAGFAASVFLAVLFLYAVVERLALLASVLAALGTALVLTVVFRNWLGVPLPAGPWGF